MANSSKSFAPSDCRVGFSPPIPLDCRVGTAHQSRLCHSERSDVQHRAAEESIFNCHCQACKAGHGNLNFIIRNSLFDIRHSIFTTTFAFLLLLFLIAAPAYAKYGGGTGEPNDPYLIYDANQMNAIGADSNDWDKCFKLMADIDLSGFTGTSFNIIGYFVDWDDNQPFNGVFDGNDHTIYNFTYDYNGANHVGLFGFVFRGEIKDMGLIDPVVDAGTGEYVGSLVGHLRDGTVTNCYVEGDSVSGNYCVGGMVGHNWGTISDCYAKGGSVSGNNSVGGLVGFNYRGTIINSYSTSSVTGKYNRVGGLAGENDYGTITNCYSTASVWGNERVGGLVGESRSPNYGKIANCYSEGAVLGKTDVGGLVGLNSSTISNCYSSGSVSGNEYIGGLVGRNWVGEVYNSFWDIETSGQDWSAGGTGLPTAEMQTMSTFTDAGWDFVGETFNGIEDIWFIPQGDYPHLWWEGMQVPMKLTPRALNCRSKGNWVKAHLTLPEGFTVADVDSDRPAVLHSFGFESAPLYVFVNKDKVVEIEAAFEREAVCSLAGDWPQMLTVAGLLTDGNIFLGTSTVRIIHPGMKVIEELASCWLQGDCVHPTWCDRIDMNRDSLVNLLDYALLLNSQVEFIRE